MDHGGKTDRRALDSPAPISSSTRHNTGAGRKEPAFGYYSKPPLIAWLIAATTAVCGDGEACVRLASPILHTVTAWVIYLIGRDLYDARVGFWSGIVYATLPGVSVSTGLISTDVPFLLCWALALWAFVRLRRSDGLGDALILGGAIGLGFLARYGMAFFVGSMIVALWVTPRGEGLAHLGRGRWRGVVAGVARLVVTSPNLYWNLAKGFATIGHTADNAKWSGSLVHPLKALEFLGAQFGVFGPVLFGALLIIVARAAFVGAPHGGLYPPPPLRGRVGVGGLKPPSSTAASPPPQAPRDLAAEASKSKALGPPPRGGGKTIQRRHCRWLRQV